MTGAEFKKLFADNDEVCVLANALLKGSAYTIDDLSNAKDHIREKFLSEAVKLIKNLEHHNLQIIHKEKI